MENSYDNTHPKSNLTLITFPLPAYNHYCNPLSSYGKTSPKRSYTLPFLNNFNDQFDLISTGSTTAAIINILQAVTDTLIYHPYVHVIALNFSKAFNSVCHSTLLQKLTELHLPDEAYNRPKDFFNGHSQCTQLAGDISTIVGILTARPLERCSVLRG